MKFFYSDRVFFSVTDLLEFVSQGSSEPREQLDLFIVSTVAAKTESVINELKKNFAIAEIEVFDATKQSDITGIYEGLGNDRVAKLLGASRLNPQKNIILMDFGTATTISVLSSGKNFKGGFIALGMRASLKALSEYCDALADYSQDPELGVLMNDIGLDCYASLAMTESRSTKSAILLGAINSHLGLINQWIYRAKQLLETDSNTVTICTGGEAGYFERYFDKHVEDSILLSETMSSQVVLSLRGDPQDRRGNLPT